MITQDVNIFDPNLQVPYADAWQFGVQRAITQHGRRGPVRRHAQPERLDHLQLQRAEHRRERLPRGVQAGAGEPGGQHRGRPRLALPLCGPGTGTSPLPIFLAYFRGVGDPTNPAHYSSTLFANSTFVNPLAVFNPQPFTAANALDADAARRGNALAAGLPSNFLVANPHLLGGANITGNGGKTRYDSLRSSCGGVSPTACSSTRATCWARRSSRAATRSAGRVS